MTTIAESILSQFFKGLALGVLLWRKSFDLQHLIHDGACTAISLASATPRPLLYDVDRDPLTWAQWILIGQRKRNERIILSFDEVAVELSNSTLGAVAPFEDPTEGVHKQINCIDSGAAKTGVGARCAIRHTSQFHQIGDVLNGGGRAQGTDSHALLTVDHRRGAMSSMSGRHNLIDLFRCSRQFDLHR